MIGATDAWTGQLDLANNALVISGGGATGTANVSNQIRQGFLGENTQATLWTGLGISSSTAADDPLEVTALGVLQNNILAANSTTGITTDATPSNIIYSTFGGESVGLNDTLVMFTYFGDVLLEQQVSSNGYFAIDTAWAAQWTTSTSIAGWINGDFDADGQITSGDYYLIDQAFAHQGPAGSVPDVTLQEDDPAYVVSLRDYFSDPLFGSETLTFAVVSNDNPALFAGDLTAGGAVNTATGELTLTLAADANGEATLTLTVTDPTGAQRLFTLHIIVDAVDDAPRLSVIPLLPSNLPSGTPVSVDDQGNLIVDFDNVSPITDSFDLQFNVGGSNPDAANGSTLSYELVGATNGATIDSTTGDVTQTLARPDGPVNEQLTVRVTRHHGDDPDVSTDRVIDIAQGSGSGAGFMADSCSSCGDSLETFLPIAQPDEYDVEPGETLTVNAADGLKKNDAFFGADESAFVTQLVSSAAQSGGVVSLMADGSFTFVATAGFVGDVQFQSKLFDGMKSSNVQVFTIHVLFNMTGVDVKTVEHNAATGNLDQSDKMNSGAFVPLNDDDDDYNGTPDLRDDDGLGRTTVAGENDLLPIELRKANGAREGNYTVTVPANVKIWLDPERATAMTAGQTFDATKVTKLYVEGVSVGVGTVTVTWTKGTKSKTDSFKVTVFKMIGPHNVPNYSIYDYSVEGVVNSSEGPHWTMDSLNGNILPGPTADSARIHWGAGEVVGVATYHASEDYAWNFEANIVKITITKSVGTRAMTSGAFRDGALRTDAGVLYRQIFFGDEATQDAFRWGAHLVITGPKGNRGVNKITVGFIQTLNEFDSYGIYQNDRILLTSIGSTFPLNDRKAGQSQREPWYVMGEDRMFRGETTVPLTSASLDINDKDNISIEIPATFGKAAVIDASSSLLKSWTLHYGFSLDIAASTVDEDPSLKPQVFTRLASAQWTADAVVDVAGPGLVTTVVSASVTGSSDWAQVTDGSRRVATVESASDAVKHLGFFEPG